MEKLLSTHIIITYNPAIPSKYTRGSTMSQHQAGEKQNPHKKTHTLKKKKKKGGEQERTKPPQTHTGLTSLTLFTYIQVSTIDKGLWFPLINLQENRAMVG